MAAAQTIGVEFMVASSQAFVLANRSVMLSKEDRLRVSDRYTRAAAAAQALGTGHDLVTGICFFFLSERFSSPCDPQEALSIGPITDTQSHGYRN